MTKQSENARVYLKSRYSADKLFVVSVDYSAKETMDLSISLGTIVGIIKDKDPLGGGDRWFVDAGETKGFLPCGILKRFGISPTNLNASSQLQHQYQATDMPSSCAYEHPPRPISSGGHYSELLDLGEMHFGAMKSDGAPVDAVPDAPSDDGATQSDNGATPSDHGTTAESAYYCNLDDIVSPELQEDSGEGVMTDKSVPKRYRVLYSFDGMGTNTLPISKDDVVEFLIGHDQEGNSEWWYVRNLTTNRKGYVPANYLTPLN